MAESRELHLWLWQFTDEFGKRRVSSWRMSEEQAAKYRDAVKVEGSLEVRKVGGSTSDFLRSPPKVLAGRYHHPRSTSRGT